MKIKWIFLIANSASILIMFIFLFVSYINMVLPTNVILWLTLITIFSSVLSGFIHYLFTKPVERSIDSLARQSQVIANGNFDDRLPVSGPAEIRDLTRRFNEMNNRLREAFSQVKRSESSRRELVANISHDLRTPMASIKAFVSAIQDGVIEDDHTFKSYLHTIALETERLERMIQQLFQLSLWDSGEIQLQRGRINVDKLLLDVLQHEQIHLEQKSIRINIDLPTVTPAIYVDRSYFNQVLFNLLDNAIRFSKKGQAIDISVSSLDGQCIQISIKDNGEGIAESDLPHIFDRTYRAEKSRNHQFGGSGLGLAIAKTIIEQHDGTIRVTSKIGKGSTFIITVPLFLNSEGDKDGLENIYTT